MAQKRKSKKSQVWLSDYTLSMLLFILAALIAFKIILNGFSTTTDFQELKSETSKISEILLSEGFPVNWTNETVIRPGLLVGKRLDNATCNESSNESKVCHAMDSNYINYNKLKLLLQTKHDFAVVFEEPNNSLIKFNNSLCVIGYTSVSTNCTAPVNFSFHYHNLVKLDRFVVYNSAIKRMVVYAWN